MLINETNYELKFTGRTLLIYKEEFGKDFISEIANITEITKDYLRFFEILYALAKTRDKEIPSYEDWLDSITDITEVLSEDTIAEVIKVINRDTRQAKEVKKKLTESPKK